jgi:hypothetical protein
MILVRLVENAPTLCELRQIEIAAIVDFEED